MSPARRYVVSFEETIEYTIDVEARSPEQAIGKVEQMRDDGRLWENVEVARSRESDWEVSEEPAQEAQI